MQPVQLSAPEIHLASQATVGRLDGVAVRLDEHRFRFTSALGSVTWRRVLDCASWRIEVEHVTGIDILDTHDTTQYLSLDDERATYDSRPATAHHHRRPFAYDSLSQLFDDPKVPDTLLVPAAGFPQHGNIGNHGALTAIQSRGLFLAAGPGVTAQGWINDNGRTIDVAPTLLAMLGAPPVAGRGPTGTQREHSRLLAQDGDELTSVLDGTGSARHVIAVVFDGCNTNLLAAAVEAGDLPNVAALLRRGVGLRHGLVSSFPTVTLPNHMSAFAGVHPGRHGIVNNEFLTIEGEHINLLDFRRMLDSCAWMSANVETVHEAVHRWQPAAFTSASYEYAERGATWSTFAEFRAQRRPFYATQNIALATGSEWAVEASEGYRFQNRIDESALGAALEQWRGPAVTGHALPTLQLLNLSLTDTAGHESGPHGELAYAGLIDSDRRLGRLLDAVTEAGALNETAVVVLSDHGMEQCDPALLDSHPHADLASLCALSEGREVGDVFLHR